MDKLKRQFSIIATVVFIIALLVFGMLAVSNQPVEATKTADKPIMQSTDTAILIVAERPKVEAPEVTRSQEEDKPYYDVPLTNELQDYIYEICDSYKVPPEVVIALIGVESGYTSAVISETDDYGYMQINSCNHDRLKQELGVSDMLDPYDNIRCGVYILADLYEKYDTTTQVLMSYNCGETGAKRLWDKGIYTTKYVEKVIGAIEKLERKD